MVRTADPTKNSQPDSGPYEIHYRPAILAIRSAVRQE